MPNDIKYVGDIKSFKNVMDEIKAQLSKVPKPTKKKLIEELPEPKNVRKVRLSGQANSHLYDINVVRRHLMGGEDRKIR